MKSSEIASAFNKLARPYLTILITTIYNTTLLVALLLGTLDVQQYITAVGPTNAMVIGFWFGERAALKRPGATDSGGEG